MSNDMRVKAAFATVDKLRINAGFEQARCIVAYEISATDARQCATMTYRSVSPNAACRPEGHGKGGGCGGKKKEEPIINEPEILAKAAGLTGVSVLFVNQPLNAFSALALNESRIFTVKVDGEKEIADVVVRLQEMLGSEPPRWLRRAQTGARAAFEEESMENSNSEGSIAPQPTAF